MNPYALILSAVACEVLGQLCLKRGAASHASPERSAGVLGPWTDVLRNRWTYAGIAAYGVELLLWIAALHSLPLSLAFPLLSLSYCGVAIASRVFLGERISARSWVGIALITLGTMFVMNAKG